MNRSAPQTLHLLMERALDCGADEVRLRSDKVPTLFIDGKPQATDGPPLQSISVFALHEECLFLADRGDLRGLRDSEFEFAAPSHGSWRCRMEFLDRELSLTLMQSEDDGMLAVAAPAGPTHRRRRHGGLASRSRQARRHSIRPPAGVAHHA